MDSADRIDSEEKPLILGEASSLRKHMIDRRPELLRQVARAVLSAETGKEIADALDQVRFCQAMDYLIAEMRHSMARAALAVVEDQDRAALRHVTPEQLAQECNRAVYGLDPDTPIGPLTIEQAKDVLRRIGGGVDG